MTKERRLAVQMWQEIGEAIEKNKERCSVHDYKRMFCQKHNLKWRNDCYLCHYFRGQCKKCPIFFKSKLVCGEKYSLYYWVFSRNPVFAAQSALDIADVIKGKEKQ